MWRRRLRAMAELPLGCTASVYNCMGRRRRRVQPVGDCQPEMVMVETEPRRFLRARHCFPARTSKCADSDTKMTTTEHCDKTGYMSLSHVFHTECISPTTNEVIRDDGYIVPRMMPRHLSDATSAVKLKTVTVDLDLLTSKLAVAILKAAIFEYTGGEITESHFVCTCDSNCTSSLDCDEFRVSTDQLLDTDGSLYGGTYNPAFMDSCVDIYQEARKDVTTNDITEQQPCPTEVPFYAADAHSLDRQSSFLDSSVCSSTWSSVNANSVRFRRHFLPSRFTEKPVLFFIHGVGNSSDVWQSQLEYFKDHGYESVAVDLIGHGFSCAPKNSKAYLFHRVLLDVLVIFDQFCKQRNAVIGHSYGSSLAAAIAGQRSNLVSHLVLVSGGGPICLTPRPGTISFPTCLRACIGPLVWCGCERNTFYNPTGRQAVYPGTFDLPAYVLHYMGRGQHWPEGDASFYKQINIPTLLVHGLRDPFVTLVEECEMEKAIPRSFLELIPEASHMVMLDSPQKLNVTVHRFLKSWDR